MHFPVCELPQRLKHVTNQRGDSGRAVHPSPPLGLNPPFPAQDSRPTHFEQHYAMYGLPNSFVHCCFDLPFTTCPHLFLELPLSITHICTEP